MRRLLFLASIVSSLLACSGGIADVAPAGDDDSGNPSADSGLGADTSVGDGSAPDTKVVDATPADGKAIDGGTFSDARVDVLPSDALPKVCTVRTSGPNIGTSAECKDDEFCDAPSCTTGVCVARSGPLPNFDPTCGCDGVTYWNDHFAHSLGTSTRSSPSGACASATAKTCGGRTGPGCSGGQLCIESGSEPLLCETADSPGTCWAIPSTADCLSASSARVHVCGKAPCSSRCDALRTGSKFYDDGTCG